MEQEASFETLLNAHRVAVERYINFRMPNRFDADDVIQETYSAAFIGFSRLRRRELFKPWILSIAKNQCNLWFRKKYARDLLSLDEIADMADDTPPEENGVFDMLQQLPGTSADLLRLTMQGYKQSEIAQALSIPAGTVKSRLHYARKQFRSLCTPQQLALYEKGRKNMQKNDFTRGFPDRMPPIVIEKSDRPFFAVKCADESFIIPKIGNQNAEGTYRHPDQKLALVSTCRVPRAAVIHGAAGVEICRDTYNVRMGKLFKNEKIWFVQLTDDYIRELATIDGLCEADSDSPVEIFTFLEEDFDVLLNGSDRVHGRPLLIEENPPRIADGRIIAEEYNTRYTMGVYNIAIGQRTFEAIRFLRVQSDALLTENFVDANGRLILLRWYESADAIAQNEWYTDAVRQSSVHHPRLLVNDIEYRLMEDRISQYAL